MVTWGTFAKLVDLTWNDPNLMMIMLHAVRVLQSCELVDIDMHLLLCNRQ